VFQACVDDLFHSEHFGPEQVPDMVNMPICVRKTSIDLGKPRIDGSRKIVQALIIDQYADQYGNCGEGRCGKRRHQLIRNYHSSQAYQMNSFALSRLSYPSRTCTTRIFFIVTGDNCPIGI
jgi:hypothetical protein